MSKQQRYTEEFKLAAVKQVTERHYPVVEVAERLGVSSHSLYAWIKRYSQPEVRQQHDSSQQAEIRRLKAELRRVTDERDILKKVHRGFPGKAALIFRKKYSESLNPYAIRFITLILLFTPSSTLVCIG